MKKLLTSFLVFAMTLTSVGYLNATSTYAEEVKEEPVVEVVQEDTKTSLWDIEEENNVQYDNPVFDENGNYIHDKGIQTVAIPLALIPAVMWCVQVNCIAGVNQFINNAWNAPGKLNVILTQIKHMWENRNK